VRPTTRAARSRLGIGSSTSPLIRRTKVSCSLREAFQQRAVSHGVAFIPRERQRTLRNEPFNDLPHGIA